MKNKKNLRPAMAAFAGKHLIPEKQQEEIKGGWIGEGSGGI